ncbi:outer membrane lipid asymmetry maintenance protein MlaD [Entomobacter blattae]|uniref:Putative phospholipid ABC transporter-binding protein MlaD n=1 Tax=Entomobacter blattae TaxID=2762277 RepID=A0A7H1NQ70_9PROT|nr:outer membrane lipid asymmetry maintenance protein MlaD [Entomobacter blattae]QNT77930.1 putative phospholipid ABC transporter-binding protein MlaD [Entomobacter blattae]
MNKAVQALGGRSLVELLAGIVVLIAMVVMIGFAIFSTGRKTETGYPLWASFDHIDGLGIGSDIKLAGITVGHVVDENVNPRNYKASVYFVVRPDIKLPVDSAAIITSDSLLGGKYIALTPGADSRMLKFGERIKDTQGSIGLQQLLSKFLFSVTETMTALTKQKAEEEKHHLQMKPNSSGTPGHIPALEGTSKPFAPLK